MAYINIKFQTDQTGANLNVCSTQSQIFNFSLTDTYNVTDADIVLKTGSGTTGSITASIHNQANGGGSVVASSTVLAANITQSYTTIVFSFSNVLLSPNTAYSLVISSSTSCSGSNPYSMKGGNFQIYNSDTNTLLGVGYNISSSVLSNSTFSANAIVVTPTPTATPAPTSTSTPTPTSTASPEPKPFTVKLSINKIGYKDNQHVIKVVNGV